MGETRDDATGTPMARARIYPEVMTKEEAAAFLGIEWRTLQRWVRRHGIPHVYLGRQLRFLKSSLLQWLKDREREAVPGKVPAWSDGMEPDNNNTTHSQ